MQPAWHRAACFAHRSLLCAQLPEGRHDLLLHDLESQVHKQQQRVVTGSLQAGLEQASGLSKAEPTILQACPCNSPEQSLPVESGSLITRPQRREAHTGESDLHAELMQASSSQD